MIARLAEAREVLDEFRSYLAGLHREPMALLVEDDKDDAELISKGISDFNVRLSKARTAKDAIEELQCRRYDVALVDLRLEPDSGLDVIRAARNMGIKTLLIVVTGIDEHSPLIKEALDSGAKFVIQKPITREHLNLIFGHL